MWLAGLRLVLAVLAIGMMHHAAAARIVVCVESVDRAAHAEWGPSCPDDEIHVGACAAGDGPSLAAPEGCVHRPADLAEFRERWSRHAELARAAAGEWTQVMCTLAPRACWPPAAWSMAERCKATWAVPVPRPMTVIVQV